MPEPHHLSDYGFDPQFDYFPVLEEAKRFQKEESSIDAFHLKLQKPFSKDGPFPDSHSNKKKKSRHRRWWKTALFFFKSRWTHHPSCPAKPRPRPNSFSGPIYITESLSGSSTPFRAYSGPLTPPRKGGLGLPYFSLRELNMDHPHRISSPSPLPIYLVT